MGGITGYYCFTPGTRKQSLNRIFSGLLRRVIHDVEYAVLFDGEIYNRNALWPEFERGGIAAAARDAELALLLFARYGPVFINKLSGVFACAVWRGGALYLFRDPAGAKTLFYTQADDMLYFASDIKALLSCSGIEPRTDMRELVALCPMREENSTFFKDIYALPPGETLELDYEKDARIKQGKFWDLVLNPGAGDEETAAARAWALLNAAIIEQTEIGDNTCAFLSGGLDSGVITAVAADLFKKQGKRLRTYSFDFKNSETQFKSNAFQPERDRPWADKTAAFLGTEHHILECGPEDLINMLGDAVVARDMPGMADIDASLMYFCSRLPKGTVALTGECSDEIFGGYPWFHRPELLNTGGFPWNTDARGGVWTREFLNAIDFDGVSREYYQNAAEKAELACAGEPDAEERRLRELSYLTIKWFMPVLAERMCRMSEFSGVKTRMPYADRELMEYAWNAPWALKRKNGTVKHLLREAAKGLLPDELLLRKKSPFPKTYDPAYASLVADLVKDDILNSANAPLKPFVEAVAVNELINSPDKLSRPWFGQLMAGPQMLAWLWQINFWLKTYKVEITI